MSVLIQLDDPHSFYTNLDIMSGKIILSLTSDETISAIVVKLEGESKTILIRPESANSRQRDRSNVAIENHKILYRTQQVFPDASSGPSPGSSYTLRAGQHQYPFRFKFPFNNSCAGQIQSVGFAGIKLMDFPSEMQYTHVTKTLPPSLTGFPGEAEIRYYVKVTVQRPSLWKGNRRAQMSFKFLPIEPPRPPRSNAESFARRPHAFKGGLAPYARKSSMFRKKSTVGDVAPSVMVDARLPSPAILTCNEPIPLRLLIKTQTASPEFVFLMSLQMELVGFTNVKALDVTRTEQGSWMVASLNGLSMPIGNPTDDVGTENLVNSKLWDRIPLPHTVTPSFRTCNLSRLYELEVRVTLGYGQPGDIQPQTQTIPLRFPVQVFSGIEPPPALLDAMASRPQGASSKPSSSSTNRPPASPSYSSSSTSRPPTTSTVRPPTFDPAYPPQLGMPGGPGQEDAPPSYEDAMADEIGPVDGPRREFSGVADEGGSGGMGDADEKRGLFPGSKG